MQRKVAIAVFVLGVLASGPAAFWQDDGTREMDAVRASLLAEWPKRLNLPFKGPLLEAIHENASDGALPPPSLTEPFAIGEALHDPTRVGEAVMSMLALMHIAVVPAGSEMQRITGRERLRITEAEARALIAMGKADADTAASDPDTGPFTFADLHRAVSPLLPDLSVEQLAERYASAYESHQDWLVPQLLLGQPVEPDAPLMRTQLWLLLADGIMRPPSAGRAVVDAGPRLLLAKTGRAQATGVGWGNGILQPDWRALNTPQYQLTHEEATEIVTRLPLFMSGLVSITPATPRAHEKHGGGGSSVALEARFAATAPAMVSSITRRIILAPRQASLAGLTLSWRFATNLLDHGTMSVAEGAPIRVGTDGVARLVFDPKNEVADGRGQLMRDSGPVEVLLRPDELLAPLYNTPVSLQGLGWGELPAGAVDFTVEWHAEDTLEIDITNDYRARILGALQRDGLDVAFGTLERASDGTYHGRMALVAVPVRTVLPGKDCRHARIAGAQFAQVVATPITEHDSPGQREGAFYNFVHSSRTFFQWDSGQPEDYLRLEFFPTTAPQYYLVNAANELVMDAAGNAVRRSRPVCEDEIGGPIGPNGRTPNFAPLNAAQWTVEHTGYGLAIPADGEELSYRDLTSAKAPTGRKDIAGAIARLAAGTTSTWHVTVKRWKKP